MKLPKSALIKLVKPALEEMGYIEFKNTMDGYQGLFSKKLSNALYLTLGFTIHRYYDSMFTGHYYLSKTTNIGATWGDIPKESYERPSFLLTDEERAIYPEDDINVKGSKDIWWNGHKKESIIDFLNVIKITELRFTNQFELIKKIEQSKDVEILSFLAEKVKKSVISNQFVDDFKFLPNKEIDNIPMIWFKAAETVLKENKGILNDNTVKSLAADAYRQNCCQMAQMAQGLSAKNGCAG